MGKMLIIAEKPSVARDIAAAIGGFKKEGDWMERDNAVVSSGIGHLVEIVLPDGEDRGRELSALPIIPSHFKLEAIAKTKSQLSLLGKLLKRKDVDVIVNACDAGREGELIFRYIYDYHDCKKPMRRMWLQSMTADGIREAFANLRSGESMTPLYEAAVCRSESDWLIGINGSRALTKLREIMEQARDGANAGRVQTPTLAILVDRENTIANFVPRDYWEVRGTFAAAASRYEGKWFDPAFKASDDDGLKADRLFERSRADAIAARCAGVPPTSVTDESKPTSSAPPKLFDLTTLQREANQKFGLSAKQTLDIAQALYETHKVLTYPRTDSSALPEDYVDTVKKTLGTFAGTPYGTHAAKALDNGWVKLTKRIFDNSKISDHFAIIPNGHQPGNLTDVERKIYDLVVKRLIAAFYPNAEYQNTKRITVVSGESFKSEGRVLVKEGWLAVYGREASDDETPALCPVAAGEIPKTVSVKVEGQKTKPPARFTEATLLGAMENAGKLIDDEELREAMKDHGLGTPATRAQTIEGLLSARDSRGGAKEPYVRRQGKELVPSAKGIGVIVLLQTNGIEALTSPRMTGDWEHKLLLMQQGKYPRRQFMDEIGAMTRHIVDQIRQRAGAVPRSAAAHLDAPCPKCGGRVGDSGRTYACEGCDFKLWKEIAGRALSQGEADTLLRARELPQVDGFVSKAKKPFSAGLKLTADCSKVEFVFAERAEGGGGQADRAPSEPVKDCPKCKKGKLFVRKGPRGPFLGCSGYPKCRHLENIENVENV
jgi:DNA topoisomerase-3